MTKYNILICLCLIFLISCETKQNSGDDFILNKVNTEWELKTISLPTPIMEKREKGKKIIVSFYNADCSFCFLELQKWHDCVISLKKISNSIEFKFILSGNNILEIKNNLESMDINLNKNDIIFDKNDSFGSKYPFMLDSSYLFSSMILDKNNRVLYIGNPTISEKVMDKYIDILKNR